MQLASLDYDLPPSLIAAHPTASRDGARMLVVDRADGAHRPSTIRDLPAALRPGDVLVVNDTRVLAARMIATRDTGGRVEVLCARAGSRRRLDRDAQVRWQAACR